LVGFIVQPIAHMSPRTPFGEMVVLEHDSTTSMGTIVQPDACRLARMYAHVVCVVAMQLVGLHPLGVRKSVPSCIHTDWKKNSD
jgi:hypothetical protein